MAVAARKQDEHPTKSPEFTAIYDAGLQDERDVYHSDWDRLNAKGRPFSNFVIKTKDCGVYLVMSTRQLTQEQAGAIATRYRDDGAFAFEMDLGEAGNKEYIDGVIDGVVMDIVESHKRGN